jgi:hypothetical protein
MLSREQLSSSQMPQHHNSRTTLYVTRWEKLPLRHPEFPSLKEFGGTAYHGNLPSTLPVANGFRTH